MDPFKEPPNYDTRAPGIVAIGVVMIILTTIAVILRFWSRIIAANLEFWWDDWCLLATLLFSYAFLATNIYQTTVGLGKHIWMVPPTNANPSAMAGSLGQFFYAITICLIKICALLLYARIFRTKRKMVIALWTVGLITVSWSVVVVVYPWTDCHPYKKLLYPLTPGVCEARPQWYLGSTVFNTLLDFTILVLPVPMIWGLQMPIRRRLAYMAIFLLGYCSAFLSFARFIIIVKNPDLLSSNKKVHQDQTWDFVPILEISMLEGPFAIMALCGPPIRILVARVMEYKTLSSLFSSRMPLIGDSGYGPSTHSVRKGSSTTAFASRTSEVGEEERMAGLRSSDGGEAVPMGRIGLKNSSRVDNYRA